METGQLSEMADLIDYKMDPGETEDKTFQLGGEQQECFPAYFPECLETIEGISTRDERDSSEPESGVSTHSPEDVIAQDIIHEALNHREPITDHDARDLSEEEQAENDTFSDDAKDMEHNVRRGSNAVRQESILEPQIKEQACSDVSTESCHDLDRDDLSDCLQVEMAIVSSDSDADEQWRSTFSSTVNKEEGGGESLGDENLGTNMPEDRGTGRSSADSTRTLECPEDHAEHNRKDISHSPSAQSPSLAKIAEDDDDNEGRGRHQKRDPHRLSSSADDLDRRMPDDYCVIQETKSEHVSTEHVHFSVTRNQWLKMEEETKARANRHQPAARQGTASCQGSHSVMYTPVRNIDRPRRDPDLDSLGRADGQLTQVSPCSEDSGLDDTSYRSPYDDPETSIEREIRRAMERQESLKRARGISKPAQAGESVQAKNRPATLHAGKEGEEKRRMFDMPEDRCRSQRSPSSAKTPTFSISASPSPKGPKYHEMAANSVIILEPDPYPSSPRQRAKASLLPPGAAGFSEWPSATATDVIILETSNLIIRSASEFCLSSTETQESTFHNNPFFKLRSHSTMSLVDQEIRTVRQREDELRRQRAKVYAKETYNTVLVSPNLMDTLTFDRAGEFPVRCKSSPSSPSRTRKMMDRTVSCDHKFPEALSSRGRRKSALAQRWEAGLFANHEQE